MLRGRRHDNSRTARWFDRPVGNGLDGAIEGLASVIVVWRFTGSRTLSTGSERRAQQLVALSFFLLAPYIAFAPTRALLTERHAETTLLGIGLSIGTPACVHG